MLPGALQAIFHQSFSNFWLHPHQVHRIEVIELPVLIRSLRKVGLIPVGRCRMRVKKVVLVVLTTRQWYVFVVFVFCISLTCGYSRGLLLYIFMQ